MSNSTPSARSSNPRNPYRRLHELCDKAITRLESAARLIRQIRAQDAASDNAKLWLSGFRRLIPYEGECVVVNVDSIFLELQELDADETFGPREAAN
jgi:hypothetical protein